MRGLRVTVEKDCGQENCVGANLTTLSLYYYDIYGIERDNDRPPSSLHGYATKKYGQQVFRTFRSTSPHALANLKCTVVKASPYGNQTQLFGEELAAKWHTVNGGEEGAFSFNDSSSFALHNG